MNGSRSTNKATEVVTFSQLRPNGWEMEIITFVLQYMCGTPIPSILLSSRSFITIYLAASQVVSLSLSRAWSAVGKRRVCRSCLTASQRQLPAVILHRLR